MWVPLRFILYLVFALKLRMQRGIGLMIDY